MAILYQRNRYRTIVLCGNICENLGPPFIPTLHFVQDGDFPAGKLNFSPGLFSTYIFANYSAVISIILFLLVPLQVGNYERVVRPSGFSPITTPHIKFTLFH